LKHFFRNNGGLILLVAALLAAVTFVGSLLLKGTANPLTNLLSVVTAPIKGAVASFAQWTEGVYNYSFRYGELEEEVLRLQKQVAELEQQAREGEAATKENDRLRELLELKQKRSDFVFESATVLSRSSSNWASTFTISKGSVHGVEPKDCVIDSAGTLVGVVEQVSLTSSVVISVTDASLEMGGMIARTDSAAVLEGDFTLMQEGKLKLSYLPENTEFLSGDLVLTSGRGEVYPSGLVVGTVEEIHTDASGMTRYAVIQPRADLDQLTQVFVIKEFDIVE
jgi:rod shape-determining protein MreC